MIEIGHPPLYPFSEALASTVNNECLIMNSYVYFVIIKNPIKSEWG